MTQTQTGVTDGQLVELLEALGYVKATQVDIWFIPGRPFMKPETLRTWEGAGAVVDRMKEMGWDWGADGFEETVDAYFGKDGNSFYGKAPTAPEAICLAARAALGLGGVA